MTSLLKIAMEAADSHAVKDSLRDEVDAIAKYRRYSESASDPAVKRRMAEIGKDEEHHRDELMELKCMINKGR